MDFQEQCAALLESGMIAKLSLFDTVVVETEKQQYFSYFVKDGFVLAYPGEKGYISFVASLNDVRDEGTPLRDFNRRIGQEVMIITPTDKDPVVEKHALQDSHSATDTTEAGAFINVVLAAKPFFDALEDKQAWLKKEKLKGDGEQWAPLLHADGTVLPYDMTGIGDAGYEHQTVDITDENLIAELRRNKQKPTGVLSSYIFVCPLPIGETYPFAQLLYDTIKKQPVDAVMVSDYEKEHASLVSHFLDYCKQKGTPDAMHCQDIRSFYLYQRIGKAIGMMVVLDDANNQEMDAAAEGYLHAVAEVIQQSMDHDHEHEDHDDCCCDHHDGCDHA